jgi:hypothetical protein
MPMQSPHEKKLSEMHDALYALGDKIREPFHSAGEALLPKGLQKGETPEASAAKAHIDTLHKAMKGAKNEEY